MEVANTGNNFIIKIPTQNFDKVIEDSSEKDPLVKETNLSPEINTIPTQTTIPVKRITIKSSHIENYDLLMINDFDYTGSTSNVTDFILKTTIIKMANSMYKNTNLTKADISITHITEKNKIIITGISIKNSDYNLKGVENYLNELKGLSFNIQIEFGDKNNQTGSANLINYITSHPDSEFNNGNILIKKEATFDTLPQAK